MQADNDRLPADNDRFSAEAGRLRALARQIGGAIAQQASRLLVGIGARPAAPPTAPSQDLRQTAAISRVSEDCSG